MVQSKCCEKGFFLKKIIMKKLITKISLGIPPILCYTKVYTNNSVVCAQKCARTNDKIKRAKICQDLEI